MVQVEPIQAFNDNYIWAIINSKTHEAWIVDPGDAQPVFCFLNEKKLTLSGILVTHHHWDHTNGIETLVAAYKGIEVYGPKDSKYKGITFPLDENDTVNVFDYSFEVLTTPGHTLDHICYINDALCFTGDTLFSAGCGRLFEGSAKQMWTSLTKLSKRLKKSTLIYCTHEYTLANIQFAQAVEPANPDLNKYAQWVKQQRKENKITLPTHFALERAINPFLRAHQPNILDTLPSQFAPKGQLEHQRFAAIRSWKDNF